MHGSWVGTWGCLWKYGLLSLPSSSSQSIQACRCGEGRDFHNLDSILPNSIKHGLNIWKKKKTIQKVL